MELQAISCRFGQKTVLNDVTTFFLPAQITAVIGPNGAGKTTLFRVLCGDIPQDSGAIVYNGKKVDPTSDDWKRTIGVVSDIDSLFEDLTVREQLLLAGMVFGVRGSELQERVTSLIELSRLEEKRDALASELSAGMRKRLSIALSIVHAPRILILDEPLNMMDYASSETFFGLLTFLRSLGCTVVLSGHELSTLIRMADRIVELDNGRIVNSIDLTQNDRSIELVLSRLKTATTFVPSGNMAAKLGWLAK